MDSFEARGGRNADASRPKRRFSKIERCATKAQQQQHAQYEHRFHYKPLDRSKGAVRLIKVYPLQNDGRVRCRIERHHITTAEYIALSYVWGSDDAHHIVLLNGQIFRVRPNLYAFLYHVAKNNHLCHALFWIDAICINQSDISEKNGHVRHMGAIYSNASRVIAWLGHSTRPLAVRSKPPNRWICCDRLEPASEPSKRHICEWKVPLGSSWEVVMHPYWSRLWIAQELGLASRVDVLWRGRFYDWCRLKKHLASIVARQRQLQSVPDVRNTPFWINIEYIKELPIARYFKRAEAEPLGNLIPRFALHDCQVGHDHAYALLSLASDGNTFEPDYNESCISLLFRLLTFCCSHPTATFTSKIGSALGLDTISNGISVDFIGSPQTLNQSMDVHGVHYRFTEACSETISVVATDVVVRLPDTNLHFLFRASTTDVVTLATTSYTLLSRVDAISGRVEQAKTKFGYRSKNSRDSSWAQSQGMANLQHITLQRDRVTNDLRLFSDSQAVLAIFELSETDAARGRLESRIRRWIKHAGDYNAQQRAFTVFK